jgi:hypothetical protein
MCLRVGKSHHIQLQWPKTPNHYVIKFDEWRRFYWAGACIMVLSGLAVLEFFISSSFSLSRCHWPNKKKK